MSEWEDFCESRGFTTGEEDYERIIDSLDNTPREIVKRKPPPCDLNQEQVSALIKLDAHGVPKKSQIDLMVWTGHASEISQCSLDGITVDGDDELIVRFRESDNDFYSPLHMLIEELRSTALPLQLENQLVVWDLKSQCVDSWQGQYKDSFIVRRTDKIPVSKEIQSLLYLLDRSKAADHSFKPFLVAASEVKQALAGKVFEFIDGSSLSSETLAEAFLVYVNRTGNPVSVPLGSVKDFAMELPTRNGTYKLANGTVRTVNGPARLTAGAILLDKYSKYPTYYLRSDYGTIYQPVFRKISEDEIHDYDPSCIFATDGAHPLELSGTHSEDRFVTMLSYIERYKGKLYEEMMNEDIFL